MDNPDLYFIWAALGLLFLLLLTPPVLFLLVGWKVRKRDTVDGFSNDAIQAYFRAFHTEIKCDPANCRQQFDKYYNSQFGRSRFVVPLILLASITALVFYWGAPTLWDLLQYESVDSGKLPGLALVAFGGAYMWVLFDEISRWYSSDLSPADVYWWCFRLAISIPMGYAAKDIFAESFSYALVFLLGVFPTTQLMSIAKRVATQKMGFAEDGNKSLSELQNLQGIDTRKAEKFIAENVTTISELAYWDPIRMTIRTGLPYSYVVDCACQALLWLFVEKEIATLRKSGLRSAYEVLDLWLELQDPATQAKANALVAQVALDLQRPEPPVRNILEQVACDPYTQFLYLSWSDLGGTPLTDSERRVFGLT